MKILEMVKSIYRKKIYYFWSKDIEIIKFIIWGLFHPILTKYFYKKLKNKRAVATFLLTVPHVLLNMNGNCTSPNNYDAIIQYIYVHL